MYLPGDGFPIGGRIYTVASLAASPAFADAREGRAAVVYRLECEGSSQALKVFKIGFSRAGSAALDTVLRRVALVPGLMAASRVSIEGPGYQGLLQAHPDLNHAHLMPWVDGPTWQACVVDRRALTVEEAITIARSLASTFAQVESIGVAHCDLSGGNIVLPVLLSRTDYRWPAELVDLDQLFCPDLDAPVQPTLGSPGYQLTGADRHWGALGDRYAGGILLAEVLSWPAPDVRAISGAESYYDPASPGDQNQRRRVQVEALRRMYRSTGLGQLLGRLFSARTLADCPALIEWHEAIFTLSATAATTDPAAITRVMDIAAHPARRASSISAADEASPAPSRGGDTQIPTWEFDVGGSRRTRVALGVAAFGLIAGAAAVVALVGTSSIVALAQGLNKAGGNTLVQSVSGAGAGLLVGIAEAFLLRRAFSGYTVGAHIAYSAVGGLAGGLVGGFAIDAFVSTWWLAGVAAGAVAGLVAGASQARRLAHGEPAVWISYHAAGWAVIWGIVWALSEAYPGSAAGMTIGAVILILASGAMTVLALAKMPDFEF
jgi:hypothetical protein